MKVFKHRNLMSLIYCVLLALPFCSILGRVLYTQWNKNAKDSYSGYEEPQLVYDTNEVNSDDDLIEGNIYLFSYSFTYGNNNNIVIGKNVVDVTFMELPQNTDIYFICRNPVSNTSAIFLFSSDYGGSTPYGFYGASNLYSNQIATIPVILKDKSALTSSFNYTNFSICPNEYLSYQRAYANNTLDNAFSYSVSQIIQDNNFGEINFVGLLSDLFLDQTNSVNALYLNFANWYMNYSLFISVVYILFLVLMWFIQFIRKLLEKGMSFGDRGW